MRPKLRSEHKRSAAWCEVDEYTGYEGMRMQPSAAEYVSSRAPVGRHTSVCSVYSCPPSARPPRPTRAPRLKEGKTRAVNKKKNTHPNTSPTPEDRNQAAVRSPRRASRPEASPNA